MFSLVGNIYIGTSHSASLSLAGLEQSSFRALSIIKSNYLNPHYHMY